MSDLPTPERRDELAAAYVVGTLSAHEAEAVAASMQHDPEVASAVAAWERLLAPLTGLAGPESPPDGLWRRIEDRIAPRSEVRQPGAWRAKLRPGWLLGGWAVVATAAAVVLALRTPAPPVMTVMLSDRSQTAWIASFDNAGAVRLAAVGSVSGGTGAPLPEDRALQLWVLPPGASAPTSLGLLPRGERRATVTAPSLKPVAGMLIEITLEPPGGSPTGRPSGPVQFIGRLSAPGPGA